MSLSASIRGILGQAASNPSGLTITQAVLLFVGVPLLVVLAVSAAAIAAERRRQRRAATIPARHPTGIDPNTTPCVITRTGDHGEVHDDAPAPAADQRQRGAPCWRVRCAICGDDYREGGELVHFATAELAFTVIVARGWAIVTEKVRCPACSG